jgi:hypothetical protein
MPEYEGLPLPPPPPPRPAPIQKAQDLAPGTVRNAVANMFQSSVKNADAAGGNYKDVLGGLPSKSATPQFSAFDSRGADPLHPVSTAFEEIVGHDPSTAGLIRAALSGTTAMGRPVAVISDFLSKNLPSWAPGAHLAELDRLQKQFIPAHAGDLSTLSQSLARAKGAMNALSRQMAAFQPSSFDVDQILKQKAKLGDRLLFDLEDAIRDSTDPQERERLQGLKNQMDSWIQERDTRVAKERPDVQDLHNKIEAVSNVLRDQSDAMADAATSASPGNLSAPNGAIQETTHTAPDAVKHVASLQKFMVQARLQLNSALAK